jgi:hypothetical protein
VLPSAITVSDKTLRFACSVQTHEDRPRISMSKRKRITKVLPCQKLQSLGIMEICNKIIIDWELFQRSYPKLEQAHSPVCEINTRWIVSKKTVIATYPHGQSDSEKATDSKDSEVVVRSPMT